MSLPKPYYDEDGITIYRGESGEIIAGLAPWNALVTDPPYGLGAPAHESRAGKQPGNAAAPSRDYGDASWDNAVASSVALQVLADASDQAIIWGGNYFSLNPSACWLVWDKDNGTNGYADCELAWTNLPGAVRKFRWRWMGMLQELAGDDKEPRVHPTQKPEPLMRWCLAMTEGIVLDPFMGSGTTLVAAKRLGRRAIGIEIEERYCEIAVRRLAQK